MLCVLAVLLVASACTKQPVGEQGAVVEIRTAIEGAAADTKCIITGTDFPSWSGREDDPTGTFGIFSCTVAAFTLIYTLVGTSLFGLISVLNGLTAEIVLLFGLAECVSGVALKNWIIKIAGFVTGIGGLAIHYLVLDGMEQLFIFTFAGLVLVATGLIVKSQYK